MSDARPDANDRTGAIPPVSLAYSVDGSPTDAVSVAFLGYFGHGFDLVASGINYGANLGDDITYSGTVSAAMEAVINNCPAFAVSQEYVEQVDFALAAVASAIVARNILEHGLSRGELINVNVRDITDESGYIAAIGKRAAAEAINRAKVEVSQQERDGATGEELLGDVALEVATAFPDETAGQLADRMAQGRFSRVPVIARAMADSDL